MLRDNNSTLMLHHKGLRNVHSLLYPHIVLKVKNSPRDSVDRAEKRLRVSSIRAGKLGMTR